MRIVACMRKPVRERCYSEMYLSDCGACQEVRKIIVSYQGNPGTGGFFFVSLSIFLLMLIN